MNEDSKAMFQSRNFILPKDWKFSEPARNFTGGFGTEGWVFVDFYILIGYIPIVLFYGSDTLILGIQKIVHKTKEMFQSVPGIFLYYF